MITKRTFVALGMLVIAAACSNVTDIDRAKSDTGPLKLNAVRVDTSNVKNTSERQIVGISRDRLASDLSAALTTKLGAVSNPNGLPANVNVTVEEVHLANIVERALVGTSYIVSSISVTDAATGEVIIEPTEVRGNSEQLRAGGMLGVVTTKSVENDYKLAVQGYADALAASLVASKK
jgi:hypothetical protein